ncbi:MULTISPECIES: type 1 glutamine amidotransferase [Phyllobacterium]|jgi:GMP synthase-like glutamine amidotransferase|uniref:GMP synthase n=1 Tax=Phyllobacterium sophorae TaxID=1520277 RepID=A0A2P7BBY5_9HYPH|nr:MULTISPECIES: type 1 glutamine amidotransferase [Phyllobacterium]PSH63981.1 GMP synthase [Phyllobacterium sophorae]UXN63200.1 type 1 glutamine amidotransferase [Phyllobacterium sp. A18/5-2]
MRVLVVQNYQHTGLGQVGHALDEAGAMVDLRQAYLGEALPADASDHEALVVLGGDQNALADDDYPYLPALARLIKRFGDSNKAVLGICLGSQLVARGYGGHNIIGRPTEFGWHEVTCRVEAVSDPVLSSVPQQFPIFHWHSDTFSLPDGAVHLASSAMTANQAFRIGRAVYGIQFHFEADTRLVQEWTHVFHDQIATNHAQWLDDFEAHAGRHGTAADAAGLELARAWVKLIA